MTLAEKGHLIASPPTADISIIVFRNSSNACYVVNMLHLLQSEIFIMFNFNNVVVIIYMLLFLVEDTPKYGQDKNNDINAYNDKIISCRTDLYGEELQSVSSKLQFVFFKKHKIGTFRC